MTKQITRCVHIFPKFRDDSIIHALREKYDYLYDLIPPHITLVFPFESDLSKELIAEDLESNIKTLNPFKVSFNAIEGVENHGFYLFLKVAQGKNELYDLHYKLHSGLLAPFQSEWTKDGSYEAHVTVGRFDNRQSYLEAVEKVKQIEIQLETFVDRLHVEIIGPNEESIIESEIVFNQKHVKTF